ncbi:hypothetical protein [Actinomadura macra]|nr:hypothetical protein [Actinomadura macra]
MSAADELPPLRFLGLQAVIAPPRHDRGFDSAALDAAAWPRITAVAA